MSRRELALSPVFSCPMHKKFWRCEAKSSMIQVPAHNFSNLSPTWCVLYPKPSVAIGKEGAEGFFIDEGVALGKVGAFVFDLVQPFRL
jgi:hypothetical protein